MTSTAAARATGRPRDAAIDRAVLEATLRALGRDGYAGLSLRAIADDAGTTRPALYRRWPDKAALVVDAVAHLAAVDPPEVTGDAFDDLVTELDHFRHCISDAAALPLAGLMLGDGIEEPVRARYRELVVGPRRARLRALIEQAASEGRFAADADLALAGSLLTGSWYALALAEVPPPDDWALRTARLVWRACGGTPPR
ncbi:TetR/AcrR family transcriptional regulator [Nocardioides fonticola]|uniref:TetR/AcrR family transcriptional regulator n=1 Tax=Nocardioides fonticola TaxID=450363 RepID=A0ABP7XYN2_9ACTN